MINILEVLYSSLDPIFSIVSFIYHLNYYIGFFIVQSIYTFYLLLASIINHMYILFMVLIEDFSYFVFDISSLIQDFTESIFKTYDFFVDLFSTEIDEEEKLFNDLIIVKFIADRMVDCTKILKMAKEVTLTLLVFLWESTSFFFYVLKCLNKAPFLAILFVAEAIDSLIFSVHNFFVSITVQTIVTLLINIGMLLLAIKFDVHLHIRGKVNSVVDKISKSTIPVLKERCRSSVRSLGASMLNIQDGLRNMICNVYHGTWLTVQKLGTEVVKRTPTKAALKIQLEQEKLERLCVVCMDGKRNTMLLNCRHMVLCMRCAHQIVNETRECPICRSFILDVINVYT